MSLETIDWVIIGAFLLITLYIGIRVRNTASKSLSGFFLGGRNLPWYVAGVSMVATTFAADTPLAVAEIVANNGISGNWIWWNMLAGGVLTTFFFARLWRRANVLTELEFLELRYNGRSAQFLRGFKSVYLGLFMNAIVIGWVNSAMISILSIFFGLGPNQALALTAGLMLLVVVYSTISGLLGVAITDFIQFTIAIIGTIVLAVLVVNSDDIGGMSGLISRVPAEKLRFLPSFNGGAGALTFGGFMVLMSVTWWASWFPGNEPGGGGYISQRMMSTKTEKDSFLASLFFQVAHYALRPWPWIIVGLCAMVLYPDLERPQEGYVMVMKDYLPAGLRGLLLAAFIGAYMSTISTQLNWGASYLTNDLYKRFISPDKTEKHYVGAARLITLFVMVVALISSLFITSLEVAWTFTLAAGSGLGGVLILRWYWYRINANTELVATLAPIVGYLISTNLIGPAIGESYDAVFGDLIFTSAFTTVCWLVQVFTSKPESDDVLNNFVERVQPDGWWGKFELPQKSINRRKFLAFTSLSWICGVVLIYSILFLIGKIVFMEWNQAFICVFSALVSVLGLRLSMKKASHLRS